MQRPDGLSHAQYLEYLRTLVTPGHHRRIRVEVFNLDGDLLSSLTPKVIDGQVVVDATRPDQPTRILDLTFLDPSESVHFEPDSPGDAPLHRKRIVQVTDSRLVPGIGWVDQEVFTGVIWDFDRTGAEVTIVGHGLERQSMGQKWTPVTFKKGKLKTDAIRELLAAAGEAHLAGIPNLDARMPERMTVVRMDEIWAKARRLSASMDRQLFYPGDGRPVLRRIPSRPVFTFDARHLVTPVTIDRDPEGVFNVFVVVGAKGKGAKKRPTATVTLPDWHPLSPVSLARNGKPLRLVKRVENRHVRTVAEAKAKAKRMADDAMRTVVNYTFDSLPIPHLDELDLVNVRTDNGTFELRLRQWTLPLGFEGAPPMSVGSVKRTTKSRSTRGGDRG